MQKAESSAESTRRPEAKAGFVIVRHLSMGGFHRKSDVRARSSVTIFCHSSNKMSPKMATKILLKNRVLPP